MSVRIVVPLFSEAYAIGKKEKPPFLPQNQSSSSEEEDPVPDELLCLICKDLMTDAVVIPCCGNSYCDDCKCPSIHHTEKISFPFDLTRLSVHRYPDMFAGVRRTRVPHLQTVGCVSRCFDCEQVFAPSKKTLLSKCCQMLPVRFKTTYF